MTPIIVLMTRFVPQSHWSPRATWKRVSNFQTVLKVKAQMKGDIDKQHCPESLIHLGNIF